MFAAVLMAIVVFSMIANKLGLTSLIDIHFLQGHAGRCPFAFSVPHLIFLNGALRLFLSQTIIKSVAINTLIFHTNKNINA